MQTEVENMVRNMNVVASLMPNDKLNTETPLFSVYIPTSVRGLWRLWNREHRESNIAQIQSCVRQATAFIQATMQNEVLSNSYAGKMKLATELQHCHRTMESLNNAKIGLENLCQTYRDDASIVAKINMIKHEIEDFLNATTIVLQSRHPTITTILK